MRANEALGPALAELTAISEPQTTETLPTIRALAEWMRMEPWNPQIERLLGACWRFARDARRQRGPARWLSLLGSSGVGKTHCARNLWRELNAQFDWTACGYCCGVVKWARLVGEQLREQVFGQYRDMMHWPLLVLDDIGSERDSTGFATEQLVILLDARERRWTILTSNLTLQALAAIDKRIASRMIRNGSEVIEVTCEDYALRQSRRAKEGAAK